MNKRICVFGSYKNLGKRKREEIIKLGRLLAKNGFEVVSGGFGGTMEDISKGAKEAGGKTIGVTYYKRIDGPSKKPNPYIDEEIRTDTIFKRIEAMMEKSDAFIVLEGGTGTLLELAACLEYINKGLMKPKPIIALGSFWKVIADTLAREEVLSKEAAAILSAKTCRDLIIFSNKIEDVVKILIDSLATISNKQ
ncbi:MAG: LOG family protein [Candidatus Omnitrophota bacterium]